MAMKSTPAAVIGGRNDHNAKAWVNAEMFCQRRLDINRHFKAKSKKLILLSDNCPAHKIAEVSSRLDHVRVVFLPSNTTSIIQPCDAGIIQPCDAGIIQPCDAGIIQSCDAGITQSCDAGIIQAFKMQYRKLMLQKVMKLVEDPAVSKLDSATLKKHVNILHCLQFCKSVWDTVSEATVRNCWRKVGFVNTTPYQPVPPECEDVEMKLQDCRGLVDEFTSSAVKYRVHLFSGRREHLTQEKVFADVK